MKLDKNKATRFKGKKPKKALPLEIMKDPERITTNMIKDYVCINDKLYVFDYYNLKEELKIGGVIILIASVLHFGVGGDFSFDPPFPVTAPFFLLGLYFAMLPLLIKNKKIVMDRMQGLFAYPNFLSNTLATVVFNEAILVFAYKGGKMPVPSIVAPYTNVKFGGFTLTSFGVKEELSFYVWYMDKNRPLPPGSAFDPYRQQDFERRKAEGFPPPLYYSCGILTPEATPEQQAEREQFWKDREYFAPPVKRPENSEIFHTRTHTHWVKTSFTDKNDLPVIDTWYEFTAEDGNIVYMLTDDQGKGYSPPKEQNYTAVRLTITERWW